MAAGDAGVDVLLTCRLYVSDELVGLHGGCRARQSREAYRGGQTECENA